MRGLMGCMMLFLGVQAVLSASESRAVPRVLVIGHASALPDVVALRDENPDFEWKTESVAGNLLDNISQNPQQRSFYWIDFERSVEVVEQSILRGLRKRPRVIVMTPRPGWESYPESVRQEILKQVESGAVLSCFGVGKAFRELFGKTWQPEQLESSFGPVSPRDSFKLESYGFGHGKVLVQPGYLDHRCGFVAPQVESTGEFRYWLARYGQVLRNALGLQAGQNAEVRQGWYNEKGQQVQNVERQPSGRYFLIERRFDDSGRLVGASGKTVTCETGIGVAQLERVSPVMRRIGDELKLKVSWKEASRGGVTRLELRDVHGRVFGEKLLPGTPAEIAMRIPAGSTSIYNTAQLSYALDGQPVERAEVFFTLPELRRAEPFYFLAWNTSIGETARHRTTFRLLKELGIDGFTHMAVSEKTMRLLAKNDLHCVPYTAAFHWRTIPWLMDKKRQGETLKKVQKAAILGRQYGILAHSLGDENYVSAFVPEGVLWDNPVFWTGFQNFLKARYGSLEALNRRWRRSFKDWSDIQFRCAEDMFSYEKPAAWVDCRQYVSSLFVGEQVALGKAIKAIDPQVHVGWDGGEQYSSYDGYDLYPYVSSFDMSNVYSRSFMDKMLPNKIFNGHCMRSFAPQGALLGLWMNGASYPNELYLTPYVALFSGIRSIWWWHAVFPEEEVSPLRSDLTPGIPFRETARAIREIKAGPAALLANAVAEKPQIAIYYSATNFHSSSLSSVMGNHVNNLGTLQIQWSQCPAQKMGEKFQTMKETWGKGKPVGHYAPAFKSFMTLIKDLNLDACAMDRRQVEAGELDKVRLLILPFVETLSDQEAAAIRSFVKNGGCVIGDYRTGVRDSSCTFREQGVLDDVFGILQKAPFEVRRHPESMLVEAGMADGRMMFRQPVTFSQPSVTLKGATAMGATDAGVPTFIVNAYGKGHALFLNCDFYEYFDLRREKREFDIREFWRTFLIRYFGMPLWQVVKTADQVTASATSVFRFQDGKARYVGVIPDRQLDEGAVSFDALVPMNEEGYLYDVLAGTCLGYGEVAQLRLTRGLPALLAVMPEKVTVPVVTGPESLNRGEEGRFTLKVGAGNHTLRVRVFAPDGRACRHYGQFIHVTDGKGAFVLPTALNDQLGVWRMEVTELASGLTAKFAWQLN